MCHSPQHEQSIVTLVRPGLPARVRSTILPERRDMNRNFSRFLRTIHHEFAEPSQFPIAGRDTHPFLGYALNVMHEVEAASDDAGRVALPEPASVGLGR
jgi:hypothetical protein